MSPASQNRSHSYVGDSESTQGSFNSPLSVDNSATKFVRPLPPTQGGSSILQPSTSTIKDVQMHFKECISPHGWVTKAIKVDTSLWIWSFSTDSSTTRN